MRIAVVPAMIVLASGCATKDWVKDLVGKREAEIDQRVGAQGQKVTQVEGRLGEVGEHAVQARSRADAAYSRADEVNDRLSRLWSSRHKRSIVETISGSKPHRRQSQSVFPICSAISLRRY